MNLIILLYSCLLATAPGPIKDITLVRVGNHQVHQSEEVTVEATVIFVEEACEEAPANTSFYAKGAKIISRADWQRLDKHSFSKKLILKIKNVEKAVVTVELIKHEQKETRQLIIPVEQ